jgi:HEAT repeat protein
MALALGGEITGVLSEGAKEIRAAAVRSLGTLGPDAPAADLVKALDDPYWEVRAIAAKALGPVMTAESDMALYKALFDQQWWVRQNAAGSLLSHPNYESLFVLAAESGDEYTRDSIISALEDGSNPVFLRSLKVMAV